ncbi:MAG: uroporphyrinogen-III C-methyltransferase [Actinobacteria bacterium]|nr:uroporphyrinogen-III C-methyltransferase [Actinomycetota bacterium]
MRPYRGLGGGPAEPGTVYLVGGGPGDPGLLTLRAAVLISTCDLLLHDRLSPEEALMLAPTGADVIAVGKRYGEQGLTRGEVDALMAGGARDGKAVVRLKGGDPFVFGRGGEEAEALRLAGIPFEIVSGVTSAVAVPAAAGVPLTHRGIAAGFAVVTGHEDPAKGGGHIDFETLARFPGTLLFLMGVTHIGQVAERLVAHGKSPDLPVAVIRWGTTPRQQTLTATLGTVAAEVERVGLRPPAVTVVGDVAALTPALRWREDLPLHGVRVLVPRTRDQASVLSARIRTLGGQPIEAPTIEIHPADRELLTAALRAVGNGEFEAVAFTSPNGVRSVAEALDEAGLDARSLAGADLVAAVGPGTASALWRRLRVRADLVPDTSTTEALAAAFPTGSGQVLLPRADIATHVLEDALRDKGYDPVRVDAYRTMRPEDLPPGVADDLAAGEIDVLAFPASSTVRNFVDIMGGRPWRATVVSIGPVTSAMCRELGLEVSAEALPHDLDGLVAAIVAVASR